MLADTFAKQLVGLMHRSSMPGDMGMLFPFTRPGKPGIWMRNMLFPIDILWLDAKGTVVDMMERAEPCDSLFSCPAYRPDDYAMYVLELNAGTAKRLGIRRGSVFQLRTK